MMKRLDLRGGGTFILLKRKLTELAIDITHFSGVRANSGAAHVGGPAKLNARTLAQKNRRMPREILRRILLESGVEERCASCGCGVIWYQKSLTLHVDHINGVCTDSRLENLRFLCPNCHSQTPTYGFKRQHSEETKEKLRLVRQRGEKANAHGSEPCDRNGFEGSIPSAGTLTRISTAESAAVNCEAAGSTPVE